MKHVFVVHNGITAVVARLTIESLRLRPAAIRVVTARGEANDSGFTGIALDDLPLTFGHNIPRFRRELAAFDRTITDMVEADGFTAYLPGLYNERLFALASNRNCVGTAFIEEGTGSYTAATRRYSRRPNGRTLAGYLAGLGRFPRHHSDQSRRLGSAYCVSPDAFPDWPEESKHVLDWGAGDPKAVRACPFDVVVAIEMVAENGRAALSEYEAVLARSIALLQQRGFVRFGVKFHPNNAREVRLRIEATLADCTVDADMVAPQTHLEDWMGPQGPLFLGATSSVLHYAILAGGRAVSMCDLFAGSTLPDYFFRVLPGSTRPRIERLG